MNAPQPRSWFDRNWKWVVSVACVLMLAIIGGFIFAVFMLASRLMHSSGSYQQAMARARQDSALVAALGTPIEDGFWMTGKINENGAAGSADLKIPLSGPKGGAMLYVRATKSAGVWTYSHLQVEIDSTNQQIDLLNSAR
jgi:hypothetical protein